MSRRRKPVASVAGLDRGDGADVDPDHRPVPVSRSKFAKLTGYNRSTVGRACRGALAGAVLEDGRVDAAHPDAVGWMEARDIDPGLFGPLRPAEDIARELGDTVEVSLEDVERMSLRELTDRHGSDERFYMWTRARKELAQARRAEHELERVRGRMASWELVNFIVGHIDRLHLVLLRDAPMRIARYVDYDDRPHVKAEIQDLISQYLKAAKAQTAKTIRGDDPTAPLRDPPKREPRDESAADATRLRHIAERIARAVTPAVVERTAKTIGRAAVGKEWRADVWDDAMQLVEGVREEAERQVRTVLAARLEREGKAVPEDDTEES